MGYPRGVEALKEHNRQVEKRRKEKKLLASIIGGQGTEWSARRAGVRSWTPTEEEKESPLKRWWKSLTSHLSPRKRVKCEDCKGTGLTRIRAKGKDWDVRCNRCMGKGYLQVLEKKEPTA